MSLGRLLLGLPIPADGRTPAKNGHVAWSRSGKASVLFPVRPPNAGTIDAIVP